MTGTFEAKASPARPDEVEASREKKGTKTPIRPEAF